MGSQHFGQGQRRAGHPGGDERVAALRGMAREALSCSAEDLPLEGVTRRARREVGQAPERVEVGRRPAVEHAHNRSSTEADTTVAAGWRTPMSTNVHRKARSTASPKRLQFSGVDTPGSASAALTVVQNVPGPLRSWSGSVTGHRLTDELGRTFLAQVGGPHDRRWLRTRPACRGTRAAARSRGRRCQSQTVDDERHVVLDEQDADAPVLDQARGGSGRGARFRRSSRPDDGSSSSSIRKPPAQSPGQLDQAALPGRQVARRAGRPDARCPHTSRASSARCRTVVRWRRRGRPAGTAGSSRPGGPPGRGPRSRRTVIESNSSMRWNVRPRPRRARAGGPRWVTSTPDASRRSHVGARQPAAGVERRRLARAVGPDQPGATRPRGASTVVRRCRGRARPPKRTTTPSARRPVPSCAPDLLMSGLTSGLIRPASSPGRTRTIRCVMGHELATCELHGRPRTGWSSVRRG